MTAMNDRPGTRTSARKGPLDGIRILDLATMLVGPMATQAMGDMGADVIKVEAPGGDLMRRIGPRRSPDMGAFYVGANRNKRSLEIDLKTVEGRTVIEALVRTSDVVVHSIRARAAGHLGLSYDRLARINPKIILCRVGGYGETGVDAGRPAYDDVAQAVSGLAMLQSVVAGEPRYVPSCMADKITSLYAMQAISMALIHRLRTGEGQEVYVPMFEAMVSFNMHEHLWGETFIPPMGGMGYPPVSTGARRPFRTADGYLCVLPYTDRHWAAFCEVVGDPALTNDPRYSTHAARQADQTGFWNEVGQRVRTRTTADWIESLARADVPFGRVNSLDDLLTDPHLQSVGFWEQREHATEGTMRMPRNPIEMSASPPSIRRLPPLLGEHGDEILTELGLDRPQPAR